MSDSMLCPLCGKFVWHAHVRHVHLHLISNDLVSPNLKTKKHYNSFRPDLGFFVSLREVQGWIEDGSAERHAKVREILERC